MSRSRRQQTLSSTKITKVQPRITCFSSLRCICIYIYIIAKEIFEAVKAIKASETSMLDNGDWNLCLLLRQQQQQQRRRSRVLLEGRRDKGRPREYEPSDHIIRTRLSPSSAMRQHRRSNRRKRAGAQVAMAIVASTAARSQKQRLARTVVGKRISLRIGRRAQWSWTEPESN